MAAKGTDRTRMTVWSVVGFVVLMTILLIHHSNFIVGRALLLAFPDWDVEYRGALPYLNGTVVAQKVVMIPPSGEIEDAVTFDELRVDVPMWQWYRSAFGQLVNKAFKRNVAGRNSNVKAIRDVRLELTGGRGIGGMPYTFELGMVGLFSASPFEAEGCPNDGLWSRDELAELGLAPGPTSFVFELHDLDTQRQTVQRIDTPGVGRVEYRGLENTPDGARVFQLEGEPRDALAQDSWHFSDDGFIAARNEYCSEDGGTDRAEFLRRHLLSAERLMAAMGVAPTSPLRQSYRAFARDGGEFSLTVDYSPTIGRDLYDDEDMSRWLPRMRMRASRAGTEVTAGLVAIPVQPLPYDFEWDSIVDLLRKEGALEGDIQDIRRGASTPATIVAGAASGPGAAAATPARIVRIAPPASTVADVAADAVLGFREAAARAGQQIRLFTTNRPARVVDVIGVRDGNLLVRWRLISGAVDFQVSAEQFVRAELVR